MKRLKNLSTVAERPAVRVDQVPAGGLQEILAGALPVQVRLDGQELRLRWRRPEGGNSVQWVPLVARPLPFGGSSWWFRCSCGARVNTIYLNAAWDAWRCRCCLLLVYPSQRVHYYRGPRGGP